MGDERQYPDINAIGEAIEGEIVLSGRDGRKGGRQSRMGGHPNGAVLDEDLIREILRERLVKQRSLADLADEYGISKATINRWATEARHRGPNAPNVVKIRDELDEQFGTIAREAWKLHRQAVDAGQGDLNLKALARLESITRGRALLHGANAPVRHDLTVAVVTEAERELQEMIREAKAAESVREKAVIDAASADADL